MSTLFGALNLNNSDRVFQATQGQRLIYEAIRAFTDRINMEVMQQMSIFVSSVTSDYKLRYKLPGGGYMQETDPNARPGLVKAHGGWDVAFPLYNFTDAMGGNDIDLAYMTVGDLERHVNTVTNRWINTKRFRMLKALFNNVQVSFPDVNWGTLACEPLANGDSVTYPPVIGSMSEATDNHYLESNYAGSAISDTNNPYVTIEAELVEHFGKSQGNDNVAVFINSAQKAKTEDLTDFVEVTDRFVIPGTQTSQLTGLPTMHPGRVIGRTNGCWVIEYDWMPSGWMLGIHLDAEPPLIQRVDPADTGLGQGLQLVTTDEEFPFEQSFWRDRFGFACGNRLAAVVMELGTGGTYSIPSGYS